MNIMVRAIHTEHAQQRSMAMTFDQNNAVQAATAEEKCGED